MMSNKVKSILITNDDGVSDLLVPTARILAKVAERITMIVPTRNRSGCSASISHNQEIDVRKAGRIDEHEYWTVSGLPNDGVRYAMRELCPEAEMVVSGINDGWNLGFNVINSGTIGAAMEGIRFGCNGFAISAPFGFRAANADESWMLSVKKLLTQLLVVDELKKCGPAVINVNLPEAFVSRRPIILNLSRAGCRAKEREDNGSVLRGEGIRRDTEVEELEALNRGSAVINVISTPWTVDAQSIQVALERSHVG